MPDKPKRRKNNRNKRKNKTNQSELNKNNQSDVNETKSVESCSVLSELVNSCSDTNSESVNSLLPNNTDDVVIINDVPKNVPQQNSNSAENLNQDLNNNSECATSADSAPTCAIEEIQISENYIVESPEQSQTKRKRKDKLNNKIKSKSLDNDDDPKIEEILDENNVDERTMEIIDSNILVSDVESDVEWEKINEDPKEQTGELATGTLSITTIPLNVAQCKQAQALSSDEEMSLRNYLKSLNLSTNPSINAIEIKTEIEQIINREVKHRLSKKGLAEDFILPRLAPPRMLDVIDEESSESSTLTSRRQSYMSDRKSDNDDLEDDVFEAPKTKPPAVLKPNIARNYFPGRLVPQECVLVGAKLKEANVAEARGDWSMQTVEKMKGAEVVYLTDSSSSTSSIHEISEDTDNGEDTDVSVRMITPTIEVTDTDNFLKRTFVVESNENIKISNNEKEILNNNESIIEENKIVDSRSEVTGTNVEVNVSSHEIVVSSTDDIKTNLYVKDIEEMKPSEETNPKIRSDKSTSNTVDVTKTDNCYDNQIKILKGELNNAINNLIKEVCSDSENNDNDKDNFIRQDSSSSICSSQCTAKYNPNYSSLNDVSNTLHDEISEVPSFNKSAQHNVISHVKDVFECVTGPTTQSNDRVNNKTNQPFSLRDICVKRVVNLPYGEKMLEELAIVSERLQNINNHKIVVDDNIVSTQEEKSPHKMPYYPLPDISAIEKISLPVIYKEPHPPPRNSSLKKSQDDHHWTAVPTKTESLYICLSPSQKMLMEKTNTVITKEEASQLSDMHKQYVDRRGYNEPAKKTKSKEIEKHDDPLIVPFKSQTGSRLLALIRDPSVTNNINSATNNLHYSTDHITEYHTNNDAIRKNLNDNKNKCIDFIHNFKPIPPPRPKKYSSSFYESDESSDFTDSSLRSFKSERKFFHYSTGNLSKDIENDISSIQNMHRYYKHVREKNADFNTPRRPSLPKDLCDQQMEYIRRKEKEVEAEIKRLEQEKDNTSLSQKQGPRAPLVSEKESLTEKITDNNNYYGSKRKEIIMQPDKRSDTKLSSLFSSSQEELLRDKMYSEYVSQMAQRQERRQHKIIKITNPSSSVNSKTVSKSLSALDILDSKVNNQVEKEFISKARERWNKLGITDPETEDERDRNDGLYREPKVIEHKIKVIEGGEEKDVQKLPSHLQEFVSFTAKQKEQGQSSSETVMITPTFKARSTSPAVWRPGAPSPPAPGSAPAPRSPGAPPPPPPPVWTPGSAGPSPQAPRKTFRPVHFEETPPTRRKFGNFEQNGCTSGSESEGRLRTSHSAPVTGLNTLGANYTSRLPKAQNPTVTLLQKAREGQIPRVSSYLQQERDSARLPRDRPSPPPGDPVHALRKEYASESEADRSDYERGRSRKMADAPRKVEGIGPTTKDGMPVALRSEVKDPSRWYKKMYDTIHKSKYDDDYVTIRYKNRRGQPPQRVSNKSQYAYFDPRSGYLSEPEGGLSRLGSSTWSDAYDSDVTSGPRRRTASVQEERRISDATSPYLLNNKYSTLASARASQEVYKNQPGRIENYVPGKSSVVDKEAKQWWDEVMDIFDGQNISSTTSLPQASPKEKKDITSAILSKSNMARALKESGYESDSTLVFRRREDTEGPLSPAERRAAYRDLQAGGEPPLRGFRSPAPPRQDESEIEYIPISSTLTKIRVHKKSPKHHEVICYPVTGIEQDVKFKRVAPSFININVPTGMIEYPPAPPRRISSKNSRTLKLVTSNIRSVSTSPKRTMQQSQSNVDFLKDKISHKLTRQNTHIIYKRESSVDPAKNPNKSRTMSTSAPPDVNKKNINISSTTSKKPTDVKPMGTSSFLSPRRTLLPTQYSNSLHSKFGTSQTSVVIEGGAGRKTPITNILDKVTTLDKLWSSDKRNERIDIGKVRAKAMKSDKFVHPKIMTKCNMVPGNEKQLSPSTTHRSRDMIRTAEKVQQLKISSMHTKSNPNLSTKNDARSLKPNTLQKTSLSKSSSTILPSTKKQTQIKTAVVANLKKKKSLENVVIRPRSVPCHESCSIKKQKDTKTVKKVIKQKCIKKTGNKSPVGSETESQFGDNFSNDYFGGVENFNRNIVSTKHIKERRDAVMSDSFFQHLFLGGSCTANTTYTMFEPKTSVLQKAKMFQTYPQDYKEAKSLNTYLIHRKPVSLSRFKIWDRYSSPAPQSPRSISWPGRMHSDIRKFDSLSKGDEFGSTSSLATTRSKSEPPINKIYFSQTSRPISPTIVFCKKDKLRESSVTSVSPTRLYFSQTTRSISPKIVHKFSKRVPQVNIRSQSPTQVVFSETIRSASPAKDINEDSEKQPSTLFFSQTSRPVSPQVLRKSRSRSHSISPVTIRSPSYRRIHNVKSQSNRQLGTTTVGTLKSVLRTRSAGDADKKNHIRSDQIKSNMSFKTQSDSNLYANDPDYEEYMKELQNSKARSERFRELNKYYTYLERVGELEKATSNSDIRHRKKDEEIIDFDRWKKIRAIERAEEELNNLYYKLKMAQNENDVLFYPRDLKEFRWNFDRDWGLRVKEKSVEDLKDHFQQISYYDSIDTDHTPSKDTYKPLWRGTSVAETAYKINRKNNTEVNNDHKITVKPTVTLQQDTSLIELRKKIGLGNRLWSSLSMEQVNALKNQLNAIYSKELEAKSNKDIDKYSIDIRNTKEMNKPSLHVRCNSLSTPQQISVEECNNKLSKSESIAAISCPITSVKELKNNVNKIQMSLSENEKRKISQTLSKEILDRINKIDNSAPMSLKDELKLKSCSDVIPVESATKHDSPIVPEKHAISDTNVINQSLDASNIDIRKRHIVYSNEKPESHCQSSASETDTASSDVSNKTVIYRGPSKEVKKKVEYFESVKNTKEQSNVVYHARENSDEKQNHEAINIMAEEPQRKIIPQSQSCTNFKELFGESEKNKFLSLPANPEIYSRSPSPPLSELQITATDRQTPDTLHYSSEETVWRSRSPSPDPERYWRLYLNLAKSGEVRRLARRFDSPSAAGAILRRHRSDPEIARNVLQKNWSSLEKISSRRNRSALPVAKVPLRPKNRYMPHIDIISKLAALRRRTTPRSRSAEEALECRSGEVDRIRRRFEAMSLLGQIYASAPDMSELRDIAPYLAGPWVAHRFPKRSDNNRSIEDSSSFVRGRALPVKKEINRSIPKDSVNLSSILKSDVFAKQEFDPAVHRPASRYEPPRAPPRPPPASWPYRLAPYVTPSRHTVTFQDTDSAPEPPRRTPYGSYSDTESPRRYLESDVNIHYRCPVRHDPLPLVPERELARQQAEHMKKLYREQRRNKYLQELQDMQNRRHQDNFTPSQKNILPLNRYDEAERVVARALYAFNGQTNKELSFRKGEFIHVRRQIDANWYEGEIHGRIGLFPYNYVEIMKGEVAHSPKKPAVIEGRARAKFDFTAQTNLELPLKKGEVVVLTRRIDHNWWEGRNGTKTGIFPDSYVTILQEPSQSKPEPQTNLNTEKPVASPAAHGLLNGTAKRSMGAHSYMPQPNSPALSNAPPATQPLPGYVAKPAQATLTPSERGYGPPSGPGVDLNNREPLYVDTNAEAVPYRAMYKYRPQNPDELELSEGDTVYVLEKCDDGWYVGSSQRTGRFGTFPGNYVERI